jgi:hypothetical protein
MSVIIGALSQHRYQARVPERSNIVKDEVVCLLKLATENRERFLRRIEVWVEEKQETMVFVTNNLTLAPARLRQSTKRLAGRALFKALKESKVKTFVLVMAVDNQHIIDILYRNSCK